MEGGVVARSCSYSWVVISGNGRVWTQKRRRGYGIQLVYAASQSSQSSQSSLSSTVSFFYFVMLCPSPGLGLLRESRLIPGVSVTNLLRVSDLMIRLFCVCIFREYFYGGGLVTMVTEWGDGDGERVLGDVVRGYLPRCRGVLGRFEFGRLTSVKFAVCLSPSACTCLNSVQVTSSPSFCLFFSFVSAMSLRRRFVPTFPLLT